MISLQKKPEKHCNGYKDKQRLSDLHNIPCSNCYAQNRRQKTKTIAHHKIGLGLGLKASDTFTMSLCEDCHTGTKGIHNIGLKRWDQDNFTQDQLIEISNNLLNLIDGN